MSVTTPFRRPVTLRDPAEHERVATPLELLFDLCFVVAVAVLAAELHHAIADGHALDGAARYAILFIPLWWAWMSHTWFATAYDNGDAVHRLLTLAQMAGVLALAATVPAAFAGDVAPFTIAYALMRLPLVVLWLRAGRDDVAHRRFAYRYAVGTVAAQGVWLAALLVPEPGRWVVWGLALAVELATPPWAVAAATDRIFHAGHIAERYGLFTIIVIGETILAVAVGMRDGVADGSFDAAGVVIAASALAIAFALWWLYFDTLGREGLERNRRAAFVWGYGHYVIFVSVAAVGAGVQAQLDLRAHGEDGTTALAAVGIPVAATLLAFAWLQYAANRRRSEATRLVVPAVLAIAIVAASAVAPAPPTALGDVLLALVLAGAVTAGVARRGRGEGA